MPKSIGLCIVAIKTWDIKEAVLNESMGCYSASKLYNLYYTASASFAASQEAGKQDFLGISSGRRDVEFHLLHAYL